MSAVIIAVIVVSLLVAALLASKGQSPSSSPNAHTASLGGPVSVVMPIHQPRHAAYMEAIVALFVNASQPFRVHLFLGVPEGFADAVKEKIREELSRVDLHVSTSNVHVFGSPHATCIPCDDCMRARLTRSIGSGVIFHMRQPESQPSVAPHWDAAMEGHATNYAGCVMTAPYTLSPTFTAFHADFHPDTDLPCAVAYAAGHPMEMPAAIYSSVYAFGEAHCFPPMDALLCGAPESTDVVYSARCHAHGTRLVHPAECLVKYEPLAEEVYEPQGDPDTARTRMHCQLGLMTLPNTTDAARDLYPLSDAQREAWVRHVNLNFDDATVGIRARQGITSLCSVMVVYNKTQRL